MTLRAPILTMMFVLAVFASPLNAPAQAPSLPDMAADQHFADSDANPAEVRASIVGKAGDEFIAKTEGGEEFRLPVDGAPKDIDVGDQLRLVPDPETHTVYVFKADQAEGTTPGSRL